MISLIMLASCNNQAEKLRVDDDLKKIIDLVKLNKDYFMNHNNDAYPGVFYPSRVSRLPAEKLLDKSVLLSLLKKKKIVKIYFYSENEIWLVLKGEQQFAKIKEHLIGYANETSVQKLRIMNSFTARVKALEDNWYLGVVEHSLMD